MYPVLGVDGTKTWPLMKYVFDADSFLIMCALVLKYSGEEEDISSLSTDIISIQYLDTVIPQVKLFV